MATITKVTTPDGVTHTLGGGGGGGTDTTYDLTLGSLSSNTVPIKLEGSDGTTDTIYLNGAGGATLSVSGSTVTITTSAGQTITYTLSGSGTASGYTITATPSSGTPTSVTIPAATGSSAGLMTSSDKSKLDGIEAGAEANVQADWNQNNSSADDYIKNKPTIPPAITVDSALSPTSTNPVENQAIYAELETKQDDLISGTNIKTINGNSILGSGDLVIAGGQSITVFLSEPTPPYSVGDLWVSSMVTEQRLITDDADNLIDSANNFLQAVTYGKSAIYVCINAKSQGDSFSSSDWKLAANENVQADWNEADPTSDAYILNKPTIPQGVIVDPALDPTSSNPVENSAICDALDDKQDELVSGTNIKTINNTSLLGSGNIVIPDGVGTPLSASGNNVSIPSTSYKTIASLTLPANGKYIVVARGGCGSGSNLTNEGCRITTTSGTATEAYDPIQITTASSGGPQCLTGYYVTGSTAITVSFQIYLYGSGTATGGNCWMLAFPIG